jgi:hypothetical protein
MDKGTKKTILFFLACIIFIIITGFGAVQYQVGIGALDTTNKFNPVKDAAQGDAISNGLLAVGIYGKDFTATNQFNIPTVDSDPGSVNVNQKKLYTLSKIYGKLPGAANAYTVSVAGGGDFSANYTTQDVNALYVTNIPLCRSGNLFTLCDTSSYGTMPLVETPALSFSHTQITTNTSTVLKTSTTVINTIIVNTAGTASTIAIYDDNTAPCDTNYLFTLDTTTTGIIANKLMIKTNTGLCALTAGTAAADVTVFYR